MTPSPCRLVLTMDCERVPRSEFYPAGPRSWKESERNIRAFADLATGHGFQATFFAVPEAAEAHADLFTDLVRQGHEVGLHLHPHTFRHGVNEYLANLPPAHQHALVAEARDAFAAAMGFAPTSFRPGHFSASAETFRVLSSLGFKRGSSAIPGRHLAGSGGDWRTWGRGCRYVGEFFDVPVTSWMASRPVWMVHRAGHLATLLARGAAVDAVRGAVRAFRTWRDGGDGVLVDLRLEDASRGLLRAIVAAEAARAFREDRLPVLTALTHSYVNFAGADAESGEYGVSRREHLACLLGGVGEGESLAPRTLTALQAEFDEATGHARASISPGIA